MAAQDPEVIPPIAQMGSLYPFVRSVAAASPLELSFLQPRFADLEAWKAEARATVLGLLHTGLFEAGITWSGVMFTDDLRTVDYLATRPEVDPERMGCCGFNAEMQEQAFAWLDRWLK
jgi:hypothetical protein